MSVIRSLIVAIRANTSGLTAPVAKATKSLGGFTSSIGKVGGALTGLTGGLTAVGAALAVVKQFSVLDELAKGATKIGATTEAFAGLKHAAELSDVPVENLISSIQRMQKTLSERSADGLLKKMGLDPKALKQLPTEEAFAKIAGGIASIENPADRAAAAMKVFGKSGAQMLPLLAEGADGVRELMAEAKRLGIAFSGLDTSKIEEANDNITRMKAAFSGLAAQIAISVAPAIAKVAENMAEVIQLWQKLRGEDTSTEQDTGKPLNIDAATASAAKARLDEIQRKQMVSGLLSEMRFNAQTIEDFSNAGFIDFITMGLAVRAARENITNAVSKLNEVREEQDALRAKLDAFNKAAPGGDAIQMEEQFEQVGKGIAEALGGGKGDNLFDNAIKRVKMLGQTAVAELKKLQDLTKEIKKFDEGLQDKIDTHGMTPEQAELRRLEKAGATDAALHAAREKVGQLEQLETNDKEAERGAQAFDDLLDAADRWKEAIETPAETFAKKAQEIADLVRGGLLSDAEGNKALEQAAGMTDKPAGERRFSEALVAGSAAAVSAMNRAAFGGDQTDPTQKKLQEQLNVAKAQLAGIKASERLLEEMAANEADEPVANF